MQEKNKYLVIINPISGGKTKDKLPGIINDAFSGKAEFEIHIWANPEEDLEAYIKNKIDSEGFNIIIAAGGDGTINKIAGIISETSAALGIIPLGSGNGFARFLKIPVDMKKSVEVILSGKIIEIDRGEINNRKFFCTAGVGFDAHIGRLFAVAGKRGPLKYIQIIMREFYKYKSEEYELNIDGKTIKRKAFFIAFANANQYGNEAQIAPEADIQDGLLNITILKPFPVIVAPFLAIRLYTKSFHKSRYVETYFCNTVTVIRKNSGPVHFDGDPGTMGTEVMARVISGDLKVIVPGL